MQPVLASSHARHVRRLHIRAAVEDDARHAVTLLTDALRTASLPIADHGRLIVIRRLPLGRIPPRISPATLALHVERVTQEIISAAAWYELPSATQANAVRFPDRGAAIVALARLHARRAPAADWFWSGVVAGWGTRVPRGRRWTLLLEAAHHVPEAVIVAAAVVEAAVRAGDEDTLLESIPPHQGTQWLRAEGWSDSTLQETAAPLPMKPRGGDVIERWQQRWGPADDRLVWFGTMRAVHENPARAADSRLPLRIGRAMRESFGPRRRQLDMPDAVVAARPRRVAQAELPPLEPATNDTPPAVTMPRARANREAARVEPAAPAHDVLDAADEPRVLPPEAPTGPQRIWRGVDDWLFSPSAGLLFLVPVLSRLGLPEWLASDDRFVESGFAARLLVFIGKRVGVSPDDPLMLALSSSLDEMADLPADFELPARARAMLEMPAPRGRLDSPLAAWLTATRRWCRRHARMGLATLIRRPGRIRATDTHLETRFELSQIDIRLRRLALDVDPGWVPWLARVVRFHYLDPDEQHR